jgi:hypothetical protein
METPVAHAWAQNCCKPNVADADAIGRHLHAREQDQCLTDHQERLSCDTL